MDKESSLTKDELCVLKVCGEEPGDIEQIQRELKNKFSKNKIKEILDKLLKLEFVYKDDNLWIITAEGGRKLPD